MNDSVDNIDSIEETTKLSDELESQYSSWIKKLKKQKQQIIDADKLKSEIIQELSFLSKMDVCEYTLYRKYLEVSEDYPINKTSSLFFDDDTSHYKNLDVLKNNIWIAENPNDFLNLRPILISTRNDNILMAEWNEYRTLIHTMLNNSNIGRNMYYLVVDEISKKLLGLIAITGDFLDLTPRDKYIGWTRDHKNGGMINHTAIASTIVPVQPFGYNYVGGKLLALMSVSSQIKEDWYRNYGNILVGLSTTSLYGNVSQYDRLVYWKNMGKTSGSIKFEPNKEIVYKIRDWLKQNYPRRYWEWYEATNDLGQPLKRDHKQRSLSFAYSKLEIPTELTLTSHQRGIYFSQFYEKTPEFLRKDIDETKLGKKLFDDNLESLVKIWREKYATKRVNHLLETNRYNNDILFYSGMIGKSWEEVKKIYLKDVGR